MVQFVHWHPEVLAFLLMVQGLYLVAVEPLRKQFSWADHFDRSKAMYFSLGLITIALAEGTVLHDLSEHYLFSAHMLQHIILMLISAPLLLLGTPPWLLRPVTTLTYVRPVVTFLTHPLVAGVAFNLIVLAWHIPFAYEAALGWHKLHYVQHGTFMFASFLFWWPVLSPLPEHPKMSYAGQLLYLFAVKFPQIPLGAALTFASTPMYATYIHAPRLFGWLTPVADQQIAGLLMSVPVSFILFGAMTAIFFYWFTKADKQEIGQKQQR